MSTLARVHIAVAVVIVAAVAYLVMQPFSNGEAAVSVLLLETATRRRVICPGPSRRSRPPADTGSSLTWWRGAVPGCVIMWIKVTPQMRSAMVSGTLS